MNVADRMLAIHIDSVTRAAGTRRRKHRYGLSLTVSIFLCIVALAVFGHSST